MRHRLVASAAALLGSAATLGAQATSSPSAQAGFIAVIVTPVGALPEVVLARRTLDSSSRAALALRYGRYTFANGPGTFNNLGLSGMLKLGRRVVASATVGQRTCEVCEGLKMAGLDLSASLYHKAASGDIGGDTDIGLRISGGYGKADQSDIKARSFAVGLPLAVSVLQAENSLLTLFISPSLANGTLTTNGVEDGAPRFMISAGLGYAFAFGLGVHASAHRIAIEESPTQFGFAMSWRFGGKR